MEEFFKIEGKYLDAEQIASAKYIGNELVIAGAGAGKTLSIVGKVKYLLEEKKVNPKEILVLAFTDKVVNELRGRIEKVSKGNIDILTFHKLGLKIFNRSENHKEIEINAFYKFLRRYLNEGKCLEDLALSSAIYHFIKRDFGNYNSVDINDIKRLLNSANKCTLRGENVNSVVALITCNMLFLNNIDYEYCLVNKFKHFLIIDKRYVIHFTEQVNKPATSFKGISYEDVPQATYRYLNSIGYNIKGYRKYNEYLDNPSDAKRFEEFVLALEEAEKCASSADAYNDDIDYLIEKYAETEENKMFLEIFKRIREAYISYLNEEYQTDFDYMIHGPIEILRRMRCVSYKYIIVDEYQDVSPARYNLLVELMKQNDGYLMAYGDDWQSIYAFSGSNNSFFMDFTKKIEDAKEFYLKNTYRNSQELIDMSSNFVMKNPCQKKKSICSSKNIKNPIHVLMYEKSNLDAFIYTVENLEKLNKKLTLMVLGRTNYAIDMIRHSFNFDIVGKDSNENDIYRFHDIDNVNIIFLTIHRSKGLEADYVFVTGCNDLEMPLEIRNKNPYVSLINKLNEYEEELDHEKYEGLPNSEERRLFYVALTRSKNEVYLSAPNLEFLEPSRFINDLYNIDKSKMIFEDVEPIVDFGQDTCPYCGGLITTVSKKGKVYRFCENKCKIY